MQPFSDGLANNLPRFAFTLQNMLDGLPGVHVGVIAADGGEFLNAPTSATCTPPDGAYLIDETESWFRCSDERWGRCGVVRNYDDPLYEALP